jgi:hypothetical protein
LAWAFFDGLELPSCQNQSILIVGSELFPMPGVRSLELIVSIQDWFVQVGKPLKQLEVSSWPVQVQANTEQTLKSTFWNHSRFAQDDPSERLKKPRLQEAPEALAGKLSVWKRAP